MSYGRPLLRTSYAQDAAILPTWFQRGALVASLIYMFGMVMRWPGFAWLPDFLFGQSWLDPLTKTLIFALAALGINILVGVTGQVSLGHAFFMGVGAYTAVTLGGNGDGWEACVPFHDNIGLADQQGQCGLGAPMWLWLPSAAAAAALVGILVAPAAVRVRGLYLAIVTVGLVFIGLHLGRMLPEYAGDFESGRKWPTLDVHVWGEDSPRILNLTDDSTWFGFEFSEEQKQFFFLFAILMVALWLAKNLVRSRTGRALQAIRDRDVAAEVMGVPEFKYKRMGFAISSAYAGAAGALFGSYTGRASPVDFSLLLSVDFIAILLIGGAGTIAGTMMGTVFVEMMPELVEHFTDWLADQLDGGFFKPLADLLLTQGSGDFGPISIVTTAPGWPMSIFLWRFVIYGVLIIVFLIFEPLGLYGIWVKARNYLKSWPFSY